MAGHRFCCSGCAVAYETIQELGLGRYYARRVLEPGRRALRPEPSEARDLSRFIVPQPDGSHELTLAIDGLQCGACVWLIERVLAHEPDVVVGRVNMTTRRLRLVWRGEADRATPLVQAIERLGYRLVPFEAAALRAARDETDRMLIRALAVAGFAAGNVMLLSIGIWAGAAGGLLHDMGPATRDLLHWFSALIAMPAIAYAGRPFFASAAAAARRMRTNMDVPISAGVLLVTGMSLAQTVEGGAHTYFDSAITLLFFLLVGRVLDHRMRGQARAAAEQLLTLRASDVAVLLPDGSTVRRAQHAIAPGDCVLVALGERVGADGIVERGASTLDASLVSGESLPMSVAPGARVFAGTLNLGEALTVRATATGNGTLLAECARLIEAAEARRSRFVALADRVAQRYAPAVHLTAALTFLGWYFGAGVPAGQALLTASAVLIVTCPCALALAVPVVQVIATGRLFRAGVLLKSATALERLADVDTVVFDKTGTLTEPSMALVEEEADQPALRAAASLAAGSRHPLARSLLAAAGPVAVADDVVEHPGRGVQAGELRLGSRAYIGVPGGGEGVGPELWLARPGHAPVCFRFAETLRGDAGATVQRLRELGLDVHLLSGDHSAAVVPVARRLGIAAWRAACTPVQKVAAVEALAAEGRKVLMVGDGLNDSASLAAASVSASPSSAADISQTVADAVFQGSLLAPVVSLVAIARRARGVMGQNLALSIGYNALM
ncbi:MAG TPA: heavy metal translocating P-type ATPase metal-binding domain-containing protein, partial [Acetobacteraceae bacterium]